MLKQSIYSFISLVTLVGGHFLNRRFDRAILFFMLFIFSVTGIYYSMFTFFNWTDTNAVLMHVQKTTKVIAYVGIALLILSAIVTFLDVKHSSAKLQYSWSISGGIGAVLMTVMGFVVAAYMVILLATVKITTGSNGLTVKDKTDGSISFHMRDQFQAIAHFGGKGFLPDAPKPPKGEGYLTGVIEYDGKPVPGIELGITLNDQYMLDNLRTDDQGRFIIKLPVGEWVINRITTSRWKNKPDGEFLLVSGYEPKYTDGFYSTFFNKNEGKVVTIHDLIPETPHVSLKVHEQITLLKPGSQDKKTQMSLAKDVIQWQAYPGAQQYLVEIRSITRDGTTTTTSSLTKKMVKNASQISLNEFKTVESDFSNEYTVRVVAFTDDGEYLSQTDRFPSTSGTFTLSEQRIFVDEIYSPSTLGIPAKGQIKLLMQNRKKFTAIELLISEEMYEPAKSLLDSIENKSAQPGRKASLMGYWYASQGQCDQAERFFKQAREEGGDSCISSDYLQDCRN